jgi:hypothetical protein
MDDLRDETARILRQHFAQGAKVGGTAMAFMEGWVACAMRARAITLSEKCEADAALHGRPFTAWWLCKV